MLSRALTHIVQTPGRRAPPTTLRIASSPQVWNRSLARNSKPNANQNKPLNYGKGSGNNQNSKQVPSGAAQGSQAGNKQNKPDFSSKQEEVSPNATPNRNTVPKTAGTGAGSVNAAPRKREDPTFSEKQDEFDTAASPSQNTAPQSTSPSAIDPAEAQMPKTPLPDLTQGIPSTWAYESENARRKSSGASPLDVTESGEGNDQFASGYVPSSERNMKKRLRYMYAFFASTAVVGTLYLGRDWDSAAETTEHADVPNGMSPLLMWARAKARYQNIFEYYQKPQSQTLLPDIDPMMRPPYVLVLSLEDLLVKAEWSREHGWRVAKRPGVDYFLRYLSHYYEIVIWTKQPFLNAEGICKKLDPFQIAQWKLFRDATLYKSDTNENVKDISFLNRDLSKVIVIDTKAGSVQNQPENAIILPPWQGNADDNELISFIPFLEYIPTMAFPDVRTALKSFEGKNIPAEFAQREAVARKKFEAELAQRKGPRSSFLTGALGIQPGTQGGRMTADPNEVTVSEAFAQGKMLQDVAREKATRAYEALEKEIRENGEKWLKEEAAMIKAAEEEGMKAMKSGFLGFLGNQDEKK